MNGYVVAIDQGTTSTRSIVFDDTFAIRGIGQQEFPQHFPDSGWVEHDPIDLWQTTVDTMHAALQKSGLTAAEIAAIGITNQRETTIVWNRHTGAAIHNAIVWQDRRTADMCARLRHDGHEALFAARTGLVLDPYFSATKLAWLLDNVDGARAAAMNGDLLFGTVDTWLVWNLTNRSRHVTDATNAARTMLYDIHKQDWDAEILEILDIPKSMLPEVTDSADDFGATDPALFGAAIPILGVAGDQQAATIGQACFEPGMLKATYGTGSFVLLNTGSEPVASRNRLLTTIAYRLDGVATYALEGSIFMAGATVQWLRDGLGIIDDAGQSGLLAEQADPHQSVYLVPAFTGLGAPHWDADARGAMFGLTRATGPREIARAALEAVCYQTADLIDAMHADWQTEVDMILKVDGGMVASDWTMQCLADLLDAPVDRPNILDTTAMGAAWLAGHKAGVWPDMDGFANAWQLERRFEPNIPQSQRERKLAGWRDAVSRTLSAHSRLP